MQRPERWRPTKFEMRGGKLVAARDRAELGVGSRLMGELVAGHYNRHLAQHARGRLLDLGCGAVPLYGAYASLVTDVVCVDWRASEHVDQTLDLTRPLPFRQGEFDTIILSDVLEHIPTPDALWREMARVLARGGRILANVPFYYWLHDTPHDYYRYTEFALRRFVREAGLELRVLEATGGALEIAADSLAKIAARRRVLGEPIANAIQLAALAWTRSARGAAIAARSARSFPLGYFLVAENPGASDRV